MVGWHRQPPVRIRKACEDRPTSQERASVAFVKEVLGPLTTAVAPNRALSFILLALFGISFAVVLILLLGSAVPAAWRSLTASFR